MISDQDLFVVKVVGQAFTSAPGPRRDAERWLAKRRRYNSREEWEMVPVPSCRCCGEPAWSNLRCTKHQGRNPCAIEGCTRSGKAPADGTLADDQFMCGTHWRALVPPRSRARRAYHRHFSRAKRYGWTVASAAAFDRFWLLLVAMARRRAGDGHLDQAAIEKLFGWDD